MENIFPIFHNIVGRQSKEKFLRQHSKVIWLVGLSGSGKSTIAARLEDLLQGSGFFTMLLDGDNVRSGLNNNLGFSEEDRQENIRRVAEVAKLFAQCGVITVCSFISPTVKMRELAKEIIGENDYLEVYVNCPLDVCEQRDVKGLYGKARKGEIKNFTGIDSNFEEPVDPALELRTDLESLEESVGKLMDFLENKIIYEQAGI